MTGDAVNVAARLQQGAAPGEILVSERTMQASRLAFLFGPAREVTVKGKPQPLRVFPLEAARSRRLLELPPFVGRQRDLEQLQLLLNAPARSGDRTVSRSSVRPAAARRACWRLFRTCSLRVPGCALRAPPARPMGSSLRPNR